jgi:hypothetical protein
MTKVELNADLIAEYLDQRELYAMAQMIKRDRDEEAGEPASMYLAMALSAPVERGHERPRVTGASGLDGAPAAYMLPLSMPVGSPWAGDPVPDEPPLGFSIEEVGALGGAGGQHNGPVGNGSEVSAGPQVSSGRDGDANAR